MLIKLNNEDFNELISKELVIVDFYAEWCGPCKMLGPLLEEVSNELNIKLIKVDIDIHNELARTYKVMSVPTVIIFKEGNIVNSFIGFRDKENIKEEVRKVL